MGVLDKFLDVMKMSDDDEDFENEEFFDDEEFIEEKPKRNLFSGLKKEEVDYDEEIEKPVSKPSRMSVKATSTPKTVVKKPARSMGSMEVRVIRPTSADDSRDIAEALCEGRTVLLNLEGQDLEVSQRIIDFTSGALFAIEGNLQKVGNYIFLLTPAGVDVSGDMSNMLGAQFSVPSMGSTF